MHPTRCLPIAAVGSQSQGLPGRPEAVRRMPDRQSELWLKATSSFEVAGRSDKAFHTSEPDVANQNPTLPLPGPIIRTKFETRAYVENIAHKARPV